MLDVCVCTHNPRPTVLEKVLLALARQSELWFNVLVVDNNSTPPVPESALAQLRDVGVSARIVREAKPGVLHARMRAIHETTAPWLLFVDDDNELAPDYVANGLAFIARHGEVGAFGGKLVLPAELEVPRSVEPFLPFFAVRDLGEHIIAGISAKWEPWEPPTAGAFVARAVLEDFIVFVDTHVAANELGRAPGKLNSCEDTLLMHSAYQLSRATAYVPELHIIHHIDPARFALPNLVRLMEGYGRSHALLAHLLGGPVKTPPYYRTAIQALRTALTVALKEAPRSLSFAYARARYHWAAACAYRALEGGRS